MRAAFVTYYYLPHLGGGTWFPYHVCKGLAARGHSVTLIAPRVRFHLAAVPGSPDDGSDVPVERLNRAPLPVWLAPLVGLLVLRPRVLARIREADVILAQFHPHHSIAFGTVVAAKLVGRPVAVRVEDARRWMFGSRPGGRTRIEFWLAGPLNRANEWAVRHAGLVLLPTALDQAGFVPRGRAGPAVIVTGNGVDVEAVTSLPSRAGLRARLGLPADAFVVVFAGRFSGDEYGLEVVLAAFDRLRRRRADALLILVGDSLPPGLRSRYENLIRNGALRTPGPVPQSEALSLTAAADVAIGPMYPTRATPLKVVEAVAVGTRVLAGEGSLGPELTLDASQIELVPCSSDALAEALVRQAELPARAPNPRNPDAIRPFGWQAITEVVETALSRLIQRRGDGEGSHGT